MKVKQGKLIGTAQDEVGRTIVLEPERWEHCCEHEELVGYEQDVFRVIESPERSRAGNFPASKVLYAHGGPKRWLAVVVEYDAWMGRVITAYPHDKEPKAAT